MQFQIPQFIETEDKIIGPMSLKQFMYIAIGGFMVFLLFFILKTVVWVIFSAFILGSAVAMAFIKYNGQRLPTVIAAIIKYIWFPKFFLWMMPKEKPRAREPMAGGHSATPTSGDETEAGEKAAVTESVPTADLPDTDEAERSRAAKMADEKREALIIRRQGDGAASNLAAMSPDEYAESAEEEFIESQAAESTAETPAEKAGGLKGLWLKLTTSTEAVGGREKKSPAAAPRQKSKEIYGLFQRITGDREMARRVDYR